MREGKLEQVDHPQVLYQRPQTPFVAEFLGQASLWPARLQRGRGVR